MAADRSLEVIEQIYREHAPRYRRVALAIVRDPDTAEDVVQEAFARAVVRRGSFRGSGNAAGWIWRIVVNTALSHERRRYAEGRMLGRSEVVSSDFGNPEPKDDQLHESVARLPERQKLVLFLRYYADLEYEAIGAVLSIAPGTVGKLLHDAREGIRLAIERGTDE
jgi:RNA polymerase sigma-70 factor (ECF subfamily)